MKEIKKEIVKKEYEIVYVANDGTEFKSKDECKKYDESAEGVLLAKYNQFVIKHSNDLNIFGHGSEDDICDIVKVHSNDDVDIILQLILLENPYLANEDHKDRFDEIVSSLNRALKEDDVIFIGRGYDGDGFYLDCILSGLIEDMKKYCESVND